ncbi:MAG TPA: hypothetical protein DCL72_05565 [Rhizobiales bacterium]|nr:hypothetical protein [Hyphomicrobiales bacterium]HAN64569.1 hypothetical protein [Hyphomicrobiales bacterium]HCL62118.1 hypothetical protein [Hyphomicrobiales bacterium]
MAAGLYRCAERSLHVLTTIGSFRFGRRSRRRALLSGEPPRFLKRHGKQIREEVKSLSARERDQRRDLIGDAFGGFT